MDPSKLSLGQQLGKFEETLRPHLKNLPFSRLQDYLGVESKEIDNLKYNFVLYGARARLGTSSDDRVLFIPILENAYGSRRTHIKKYEVVRLIFGRNECAGGYGIWGFHKAEFHPTFPETIKSEYGSTMSEIIFCQSLGDLDAELDKIKLPPDFIKKVKTHIGQWIRDSIVKRKTILDALEDLQKKF
ncbi:MAG: hypothetical protein WC629_02410 [Candidatus Paceibacterota bacterium]|jgi:hypothetical protein